MTPAEWAGLTLLVLSTGAGPPEEACPDYGPAPFERGVALGLFSADSSFRYRPLLEEIAEHGASHVSVVWVWWQEGLSSVHIQPKPAWSATEAQVVETIEDARELGLHVTLFPIVRLAQPKPGDWRGKIAPADEDRWWASYEAYLIRAAALADRAGARRLSVGSELLTRERMRLRWARVIERVRMEQPRLQLMYSANWDHYRPVRFWDLVDVVGLTAYWEVGQVEREGGEPPTVDQLVRAWNAPRRELGVFAELLDRPLVLTEIGYPSLSGGTRYPWNETRRAPISLTEQAVGYEAAARALSGEKAVRGVFWWNWFGFGGAEDGDYTPRGKPAARILRCWFRPVAP